MRKNTDLPPAAGPHCADDLRRIQVFVALSADALEAISPILETRRVRARGSLFFAKELADTVAFVWSGRFHQLATSPSGALISFAAFGPGAMIGYTIAVLGIQVGSSLRLDAEQDGVLLCAPSAKLLALASRSLEFSQAVAKSLAQQAADYGARVYEFATFDLRTRLQAELLRLTRAHIWRDGVCVIEPAPTQAELAARIGATREAVSRQLSDMAKGGLIKIRRRMIAVTNLNRWDKAVAAEYFTFLTKLGANS